MSFNKTIQAKTGAERRRIATDNALNRANFISIIQRRRIQSGQSAQTDAQAEAAASAEYQATLDAHQPN